MNHGGVADLRPEKNISGLPREVLTLGVKNGIMYISMKENRGDVLLSFIK